MNAEQKERAIQLITTWRTRSITTRPEESAVYGDCMTDILQELVDAPAPEPFGYFKSEPFGWTDCAETDDGAIALYTAPSEPKPVARVTGYYAGYLSIATVDGRVLPAGTALYLAPPAPPAPSVPDGWKLVPVEPTPEPFGYFKAEPFGWTDCAETDDGAIALFDAPPAPSVPDMRLTGQWESSRIADYNRGWNECRQAMLSAAPTPAEAPADVARDAWYGSNPPSLVQATAIYMALLEAAKNQQKLSDERILELFYEHATPDRWPFGFARAIGAAMREKGQS